MTTPPNKTDKRAGQCDDCRAPVLLPHRCPYEAADREIERRRDERDR